jgi:putative Mg2+ transporter-C (MgtC) family protein
VLSFLLTTGFDDWQEPCLRLALAAFAGGLVGAERERHAQIAGIRTHAILAIGAALTMLVSVAVAEAAMEASGGRVPITDPGRIAAQVVSGIGFLGAGAIIRLGSTVRGLTTAASLWAVAGVGLAVGAGYYVGAGMATLLLIVVLHVVELVSQRLRFGRHFHTLRIESAESVHAAVTAALQPLGIVATVGRMQDQRERARLVTHFSLRVPDGVAIDAVVEALRGVNHVTDLRVE